MNKKIKILISIILIFLLWAGVSTCTVNNTEDVILQGIEKSEQFKRWEELPEEERENTIQPLYGKISFNNKVKTSTYNSLINLKATLNNKYNLVDRCMLGIRLF